mmetsp:Transcript_71566/g.200687  ORF Transcript_71566/g.200687 Transcript_71566/m.200687 type:complete len:115 (+) Transcript_71566:1553-1897(+)
MNGTTANAVHISTKSADYTSGQCIVKPKGVANGQNALTNLQVIGRTDIDWSGQVSTVSYLKNRYVFFRLDAYNISVKNLGHTGQLDFHAGRQRTIFASSRDHMIVSHNMALLIP